MRTTTIECKGLIFDLDGTLVDSSICRVLSTSRIVNSGLPLPEVLITADDIENGKPDPEPFLKAAEIMGIDPRECVVFEDSVAGIKAGLTSGATVIGVNALDGFEMPSEAEHIIKNYNDISLSFSEDCKQIKIVISCDEA